MLRRWKATAGAGGARDFHHQPRRQYCVALSLFILVSATMAYLAFFPLPGGAAGAAGGLCQWRRRQGSAGASGELRTRVVDDGGTSPAGVARTPTSLSHIVFGIGGSARTWGRRRGYVELWWRPGQTRGHVWLDEAPAGPWPAVTSPPYRVSPDASRFGRRAAASRMARIVADSFAAVTAANGTGGEVRWFVMGDDDTVFFPANLVAVLRKYDHEEMYYVGAPSESVAQDVKHSYGMAFGGGGFAVSYPAAAELAKSIDGCLDRYRDMFGSDERVHACLSELGIPLTREPGFHQVDLRGDAYGVSGGPPGGAAGVAPPPGPHPAHQPAREEPRWTQCGLWSTRPGTTLPELSSRPSATTTTPPGAGRYNWSVSVAWGYTAQVYPWAVPAHELEVPLRTFEPLGTAHGLLTFNTRPWRPGSSCARPETFFLSRVRDEAAATMTEYARHVAGKSPEKECGTPSFRSAAAVQTVRVLAPKMSPSDWHRAPRRHCCETRRDAPGTVLEVRIRRCTSGGVLAVATP